MADAPDGRRGRDVLPGGGDRDAPRTRARPRLRAAGREGASKRLRRAVLLVLAVVVVALVATSFALARKPPAMSATDSVTFARRALAAAGVEGADVGRQPRTSMFTLDDGTEIEVWIVPADVRGELVEVYVPRSRTLPCDDSVLDRLPGTRACPADRAVNLDDEVDDGRFLFTEDQFAALEDFRFNPALDRQGDRRIGPAVAAGALVALVGVALAVAVGTGRTGGARRSRKAPPPG